MKEHLTTLIVAATAAIRAKIPFTPTFRADRPFIYLIRDRESRAVLFLGRMLNPSDLAD